MHPRDRNNRLMSSSDEEGSAGYFTAFSKSRSRSAVRGKRDKSRLMVNPPTVTGAHLVSSMMPPNIKRVVTNPTDIRSHSNSKGRQVHFPSDLSRNDSLDYYRQQ